ncbi:hypothetical protein B0H13DRAFT_2314208 [Mycena leptocephala]|nr:hypothetical protein B0H13DRAFT_2314208 [Mycena leptocephala]
MSTMHGMTLDLQQEVFSLTGENMQIKAQINQIMARIEDGPVAENSTSKLGRKRPVKGIANQHPQLKNDVHAMLWRLIGIDANADPKDKDEKMYDGHDGEAHYVLADTSGGTQSKVWKPNYMLAVNTTKNKAFISELVERVHETEQLNRQNAKGRLPDESFNKDIIKSIAQTCFSSVASTFKKMRTDGGRQKLVAEAEVKKHRGRRETVTAARRDAVPEFEQTYGAALLDTDFASSAVSIDEEEISEATSGRRKAQGRRPGDWMVIPKGWRRKAYLRFLRELDRFVAIKLKAQALKKLNDGPPPPKKHRPNPKKSTPRFHATVEKASNRPPKSSKNPPILPISGMVKTSWNAAQATKVVTLPDPEWWGSWVENADDLPSDIQEFLDELPSDTD